MKAGFFRKAGRKLAGISEANSQSLPENFNLDKKDLIDFAFQRCRPAPRSFADLGGVWGVDGAYTFYTLGRYELDSAYLVDARLNPNVIAQGEKFPQLKLIEGVFGERRIHEQIGRADAVFLFDILLHQANPSWDEILSIYSAKTRIFVVFGQQWIKTEHTVRLFDLGPEEYFKNVPHDQTHPSYVGLFENLDKKLPNWDRPYREKIDVWQWGITDKDLIESMRQLGFTLQYFKNCGPFQTLENFENHAFVFQKI
ncbi:MAG: hypothetical protein V2A74_09495 [bacterium]